MLKKVLLVLCVVFCFGDAFADIVDHQGRELGVSIPQWVLDVKNFDVHDIRKHMGIGAKYKLWVVSASGDELDATVQCINSCDADVLACAAEKDESLDLLQVTPFLTAAERELFSKKLAAAFSVVSVTGLEKTAMYWYLSRDAGRETYHCLSVYCMPNSLWKKQIQPVLKKIRKMNAKSRRELETILYEPCVIEIK
ncbi:MAG: hypothetical protein K6G80_09585 [Treponema sp.]|nr:hypothetical protein [Treponema sp.]